MQQEAFNLEFNRMFKWLGNDAAPSLLKFEADLYKKLWNFFLIGDSYYFIINHHSLTFEFMSKELEDIMGYHPSEVDISFMNGKLHPDDRSWFLAIADVISKNDFIESKEELTKREKQVLKLLIDGKLSREISSILNISKQTVDTHRKNMLHRKDLSNTSELIGKAIRYGWI